jgi:WS/DGAT/MGAT family acyltransferase
MKRARLLDSAWLLLEKPETPMHVGILLRFTAPTGTGENYVRHVLTSLRRSAQVDTPWDLILPLQRFRGLIPLWMHDSYVDMDYHVQMHTLAEDAGEAGLSAAVSQLHAQPLDRSRPLWECHVFEGMADGQFALYVKVHHAVLDGVGGIRLMQQMLTNSAEDREHPTPWAAASAAAKGTVVRLKTTRSVPRDAMETAEVRKPGVLSHLGRAAREMVRAAFNPGDFLVTPYKGPSSPLNRPITQQRSFAQQSLELARVKRIARLSGGSTNDVVLAICSGAMQKLLREQDALPARSLTAAVPVSTRQRHDRGAGTAISFCLANLGTDIVDPRGRLMTIQASTNRAKEYFGRLPREAQTPYTAVMMLPFLLEQLARRAGRYRPMFNVVISNVPGPKSPLYLDGARLESAHPLSVLFHGQALNITCLRYVDRINFGFTGCADALAGMEKLPDYTREALDELEAEFSFPHQRMASASREEPAVSAEEPPQLVAAT